MTEERVKELELQLVTANEQIAKLTAANVELNRNLSDADTRNRKLRRSARRDETTFKEQLATVQSRRG